MAKDLFHNTVKTALQKDGWNITHDPYQLRYGLVDVYSISPPKKQLLPKSKVVK